LARLQDRPINDDDLYEVNALTGAVQSSYGRSSISARLILTGKGEAHVGYVWLTGLGVKALQSRLGMAA
jgi:hypothetical protein